MKTFPVFFFFLLNAVIALKAERFVPNDYLLQEWPMIMAHDAATTYLDGNSEEILFAKTQPSGGFKKLLDCGARSLDIRVGPLVFNE